jgi:hypothetical protein
MDWEDLDDEDSLEFEVEQNTNTMLVNRTSSEEEVYLAQEQRGGTDAAHIRARAWVPLEKEVEHTSYRTKACGVFGIASEEYLNYAQNNRVRVAG